LALFLSSAIKDIKPELKLRQQSFGLFLMTSFLTFRLQIKTKDVQKSHEAREIKSSNEFSLNTGSKKLFKISLSSIPKSKEALSVKDF